MSITSEQACWKDFGNVISHVGLDLQNSWLCSDNLFLMETEDWLCIFVSCIQAWAQLSNSPSVKTVTAFNGKLPLKILQGQTGHSYKVKSCSPFLKRRINVSSLVTMITQDCQKD